MFLLNPLLKLLVLLLMRRGLLRQNGLLKLLQLCHILLQRGQLLLVGDRVLLQVGQGLLVLLFELSLLDDLLLQLLVQLLQLLQLCKLLRVLLQRGLQLGLLHS